jgi:hypothetical protein
MDAIDERPPKLRTAVCQLVKRLLDLVGRGWVVLAQGQELVVDRF